LASSIETTRLKTENEKGYSKLAGAMYDTLVSVSCVILYVVLALI